MFEAAAFASSVWYQGVHALSYRINPSCRLLISLPLLIARGIVVLLLMVRST